MKAKVSSQMERFFDPMFANCVHVKRQHWYILFTWKFFNTLKYSSGHVECSFDNPAENFSKTAENF